MRTLLLCTFLMLCLGTSAQTDSLNRFVNGDKKDGYWKQYIDSLLYPCDSANAFFYGYNLYDSGLAVFTYNRERHWKKCRMVYDGTYPKKGSPQLLNGTFMWYENDTQLVGVETYREGHPFFWEAYTYRKTDPVHPSFTESFYFDTLYNNTRGTYLLVYKFSDMPSSRYWYYEGPRGWRIYKITGP